MKKTFKLLSLCAMSIIILITGCKKDEQKEPNKPNGCEPDEISLVKVTSLEPTFIKTNCHSEFSDMLSKRFINSQSSLSSAQTRIAIIDKSSIQTLSIEEQKQLAQVYCNGGSIIYMQPTLQDLADFATSTRNAIILLGLEPDKIWKQLNWLDYYRQIAEANPEKSSEPYEAIAISNSDAFLLTDLNNPLPIEYTSTAINQETGETVSTTHQQGASSGLTSDNKELIANDLVKWIKNASKAHANGKQDTEVSTEITLYTPIWFYPSEFTNLSWYERCVSCQIKYSIWSIYDLNLNKDNYVIHRNIEFDGSELQCGPENPDIWWYDKDHNPDYYGPYLHDIQVQSFLNGSTPELTNWKPQNTMNTTTYTDQINWNLSGALNISSSPGLSIGGGVSVTKAVSTTLLDLGMEVWHNTNSPKYKYQITTRPQGHFWGANHDIVAANLRQDISMQQGWTWIVTPEDYATYSFNTDFDVCVEFLRSTEGFFQYIDEYHSSNIQHHGLNVTLPAPPRAIQEWRMYCVTDNQNLINFISQYYEGYFYNKLFQVPAATSTDKGAIDQFIENFEARLYCDRDMWRTFGFTGDFEFVWRPSTSSEIYRTTHFHVNP